MFVLLRSTLASGCSGADTHCCQQVAIGLQPRRTAGQGHNSAQTESGSTLPCLHAGGGAWGCGGGDLLHPACLCPCLPPCLQVRAFALGDRASLARLSLAAAQPPAGQAPAAQAKGASAALGGTRLAQGPQGVAPLLLMHPECYRL